MTLPGFPSRIVLWHWSVTPGIADSRTFTFLDAEGGDYDPGVVTAKAKDGTVSATVTGTGNTRIVTWSAEQTAALPPTHWRLNFDGEDQVGGRIEISQPEPTPDLSNDWTIQLPGDAEGDGLTITVAGAGGTIGGGGGGTVDHEVVLFATDVDMSGGSWTDLPNYSGGTIPRAYLAGVTVLVVAGGDLGLWTITASGPCTPGAALAPGESIGCTAGGTGWFARTDSADNTTVSGVTVMAKDSQVREVHDTVDTLSTGFDTLSGTVGTQGATLDTLDQSVESLRLVGDADAVAGDLRDRATVEAAPTAWAVCGEQDATLGDACYFRCTTVLPPPTDTLEVRATARFRSHKADSPFAEIWSEPKDAAGVPGAGGVWDRYELAFWSVVGETVKPEFNRLWLFWEYTQAGGTIEEWLSGTTENPGAILFPAYGSSGAALPANTWVTVAVFMDMATGTTAVRVRTDTTWDFEHPDDGTRWRTLRTYVTDAGTTSLAASDEVEQWIGRGGGRFDVARVQVWLDGVAAMDFDPSTALDEATTVTDSVLLDASDDPAVWEAHDLAVIHNP